MTTTMRFVLAGLLAVVAIAVQAGEPVLAVPDAARARTDLATLTLPVSLDLELVDGISYPGFRSLFRRGDTPVRVLPGEREIAVRYNQLYNISADSHEVVKSKIIVLKFIAEPGKSYRATHQAFRDVSEARAGTKNFVVRVIDEQGINRVVEASQVQKNWKGEETTTTRKDLVNEAAVAAAPAVAAVPVAGAVVAPAAPAGGLNAGELLKFTWQNASATERAAFLEWVKTNP